jgi:hypothetical protein
MTRRTPALLLAVAAAVALSACAHSSGTATSTQRSPATVGLGADPTEPSPADSGAQTDSGTQNGGGTRSTPTPTPSRATGGGPQIVFFTVTRKPACPVVPTKDNPQGYPPQPVTISWKVTGASGVGLSVDQPNFFAQYHKGSYRDYSGSEGSETLSFPCDTTKNTSTHTYTINTLGANSAGKTITVSTPSHP